MSRPTPYPPRPEPETAAPGHLADPYILTTANLLIAVEWMPPYLLCPYMVLPDNVRAALLSSRTLENCHEFATSTELPN